jgi:L-iditol 2-dehydrogenase
MRAAVYHGPGDLRVEDWDRPKLGPDEALLRVSHCGICGTDHRIVAGKHRLVPPGTLRVLGHEIVGEIVETGSALSALPTGPVIVAPNMGCGHCRECRSGHNNRCSEARALGITEDGAFVEYLKIPAAAVSQGNVIPLAAGVDPLAAALIEPLACVLRGQEHLDIEPADAVLVVGAGPIGLLHVMLARMKGAERIAIADRWPQRLALAQDLGADRALDLREHTLADAGRPESGDRGFDVIIVAAPSLEADVAALDLAAPGGRINWFAGLPKTDSTAPIDTNIVHYKELRVTGTSACSTSDCQRAAEIVNSGRLDVLPLVTRVRPLEEAPKEFVGAKDHASLKTVLTVSR